MFHVIPCQPIAGQTAGTVSKIDLQVVVEIGVVRVLLLEQLFQQGRGGAVAQVLTD